MLQKVALLLAPDLRNVVSLLEKARHDLRAGYRHQAEGRLDEALEILTGRKPSS